MLLRRIAVENFRSFLDRTELVLDGQISIAIGPNGGGKTNLLDAIVIVLRRFVFASMYAAHVPTAEQPYRYEFRSNDALNNMTMERHSEGTGKLQVLEVEIEVTATDIKNMVSMKNGVFRSNDLAKKKYHNLQIQQATAWNADAIKPGDRFVYRIVDGGFQRDGSHPSKHFHEYLQLYEIDRQLREEFELSPLTTPMVYLPVNRTAAGFSSNIDLSNYNEFEQKRQNDAALSKSNSAIVALAVGRLAQKFRLLLEKDQGIAAKEFKDDKNLAELTGLLGELGYDWRLVCVNPLKNQYDLQLQKQGSLFSVGTASSGERELLTYLFAIFALNVRDALIIVDEPELHLHPQWQHILLRLFIRLAKTTGNQFLLATHAPTFVAPDSIQYVSRVFSRDQKTQILRLNAATLPDAKHLFNIVNSQNNERIFFADEVVLVEGLLDRIFFEAVFDHLGRSASKPIVEVISVGGKGFFLAYTKLLKACQIPHSIIADLDYVEQIGTHQIKDLFKVNDMEIKRDVIESIKSLDGATLVAQIDQAVKTGNWSNAQATWDYIKSRHLMLREDLSSGQKDTLHEFVINQRGENIYVLEHGPLESYLPDGYKSKDLEKLIRLVASADFWDQLPVGPRDEIEEIARLLLKGNLESATPKRADNGSSAPQEIL